MGSVAGPGARWIKSREQEPSWLGFDDISPCNYLPDIQVPKSPLGL